ncbi:MAG: hypothetical protein RLZ37_324, partial [Actinomycetota bacterium]
DCLDEHPQSSNCIEQANGLGCGERKTPEMSSRGHRPDEDSAIGCVILHSNTVAENRPARERRRRIDRKDCDFEIHSTQVTDHSRRERALARPRSPRQADRVTGSASGIRKSADCTSFISAALDHRQQSRERASIPFESSCEEDFGVAFPTIHTFTTSVTPSTRSRMIRSIPCFRVCVDAGHVPHAPINVTVTTPVSSSTSFNSMSPLSA